jgi:hypothetical protein
MEKGKYDKAFKALKRLRKHEIQAARDMYYAYKLLEIEKAEKEGRNIFKEFFTVMRNRRAAQSSFFVMFMQQVTSSTPDREILANPMVQFCGVNVIAYYSTSAPYLCSSFAHLTDSRLYHLRTSRLHTF